MQSVTAQIQEVWDSSRLPNYENSKLKKKGRESRSAHDLLHPRLRLH
jgi:hypothetical protein